MYQLAVSMFRIEGTRVFMQLKLVENKEGRVETRPDAHEKKENPEILIANHHQAIYKYLRW